MDLYTSPPENDENGWSIVLFRWHLAELGLLGVLIFFCTSFRIPPLEQAYHVAISLSSFALVRCLESANRMDERVTECSNLRQVARRLHMVAYEKAFQAKLETYRLICRHYYQYTGISVLCWAIVAHSYVQALSKLMKHEEVSWPITFFAFAATSLSVVVAVRKTWLSAKPDPELSFVRFGDQIRKLVDQLSEKRKSS